MVVAIVEVGVVYFRRFRISADWVDGKLSFLKPQSSQKTGSVLLLQACSEFGEKTSLKMSCPDSIEVHQWTTPSLRMSVRIDDQHDQDQEQKKATVKGSTAGPADIFLEETLED